MAHILRQSTAVDVLIGPFVDLTDGATAETGESPSVKLSKNGQALAAKNDATTPVHDADGYYNCELDATDTNTVGTLLLTVAASANALPVRHEFQVVEEAIYDGFYAASAARLPADVTAISGDTTAADNLEAATDGTGYDIGGIDVSELNGIVDDWIDAGRLDAILDAILVDTAEIGAAGAGLTEAGGTGDHLTALATQATADAIETDTQDIQSRLPAALVNSRMDATVDGTGMETGAVDAFLTRQMTEAYAANGVAPTLAQGLFAIHQMLMAFAISGTTISVKQLDGTTEAFTATLDDDTNPTEAIRS